MIFNIQKQQTSILMFIIQYKSFSCYTKLNPKVSPSQAPQNDNSNVILSKAEDFEQKTR